MNLNPAYRPKVLMLGWEFPPVINGGLGVACHDLCIAMGALSDVSMILPKSSPDFFVKNVRLIGLNYVDADTFSALNHARSNHAGARIFHVAADLDPYYTPVRNQVMVESHHEKIDSQYIQSKQFGDHSARVFSIDDLYGGDVIEKVTVFGRLAAGLARKMDFDIIHAHDWMTMIAGMEIKRESGKPLVLHIHSLEVDRGGPGSRGWVYQMEKKGMEAADLLMPVSEFTGHNIHEYYGISWEKIKPVHNGIRPVSPFRSAPMFKEKMVLFVGRLTRQKGPELLLDIAEKVLQRQDNIRFVMAGTGEYFNALLEKAAQKGIAHRFHLTGFLHLDQVRRLLSVADAYIMPSVSEPFGLSAVEAVQFGVPAIISKQSGVAEVLHGALKFDYWDTEAAASYILQVINDPVLSAALRKEATKDLDAITWELAASKVIREYAANQLLPYEAFQE